jgi:asparagine synthase (glutamine-hydrolysing)
MCGFSGVFALGERIAMRQIFSMTEMIHHRGPDGEGYYLIDSQTGQSKDISHSIQDIENYMDQGDLVLGFKRLAIIDLSQVGLQPFKDQESGNIIVFNGEIFNYIELKVELINRGHKFISKTDTEVLLKAYEEWGVDCLNKLNGMWSFAIWDNADKKLFCSRDRYGIKPFYFTKQNGNFIFGSELKQLLLHIQTPKTKLLAIQRFMFLDCVQWCDGTSMVDDIFHLPAGHYIEIDRGKTSIRRYYNPKFISSFQQDFRGSFQDAIEEYLYIFTDSVRLRLRSDAPVGSALSGGLDSSAIVSVATANRTNNFKTFTAWFEELGHLSERKWAELVCSKTNSLGNYISPTGEDCMNELEEIVWKQDIPLTSSSLAAQYFVMKKAKESGVTVMLDGQGADEILAGYSNSAFNHFADRLGGFTLSGLHQDIKNYSKSNSKKNPWRNILAALFLGVRDQKCLEMKRNARGLSIKTDCRHVFEGLKDFNGSRMNKSLLQDLFVLSIPNLLHYEDRNSMAHSVEARVPFLDYRLVEFAYSLPDKYKFNRDVGKYIHREALAKVVPKEVINRKDKVAFKAPGEIFWLRNSMKEVLSTSICNNSLVKAGMIERKLLNNTYNSFINGSNENAGFLWKLVMIETWLSRFNVKIDSDY